MANIKKVLPDERTTELFVPSVMNAVACQKHNAPLGIPCFHIPRESKRGYEAAICNNRALHAGFNAPIDPRSVDRSISRPKMTEKKHAGR